MAWLNINCSKAEKPDFEENETQVSDGAPSFTVFHVFHEANWLDFNFLSNNNNNNTSFKSLLS